MKLKRLLYFYLFLAVFVVCTIVLVSKISKKSQVPVVRDWPQIERDSVLNIVTDYNSVGYFVSGGSIMGFQYEMVKELEKAWGLKIALFLENSLEDNLKGLTEQKYDIVARNIPVNFDLRENFAFTNPITFNRQVLVQRKAQFNDSIPPVRQHLNLAKKTIFVSKKSPAILRLNNLSHEIGDTIYIRQDETYNEEQLVMRVAAGEIDFTIIDEITAKEMAARMPEIDIDTDISFTQLESWALRKTSPILLDSLNGWLSDFKKTKKFNAIRKKYY
ncbi:MAG: transporter substrate-binding domain-containing protein [Dysgonamonadaceae bacterium]|jgi:membrane-bound lytic murein transglycosylase MltF|nr:transporter substrate-binding domain-containing protein [Dysgonamonadaceae bacterium]